MFQYDPRYAMVKDEDVGRIESVMSDDVVLPTAGTGTTDGNLSAKEKKRLEKEAKAREKKEKEETKKRLKEQDRIIKEEAKKKTETPAERRRRLRREKENTSAAAKAPKTSGIRGKKMTQCRVRLLDGTDYEFEIEVRSFLTYISAAISHSVVNYINVHNT